MVGVGDLVHGEVGQEGLGVGDGLGRQEGALLVLQAPGRPQEDARVGQRLERLAAGVAVEQVPPVAPDGVLRDPRAVGAAPSEPANGGPRS